MDSEVVGSTATTIKARLKSSISKLHPKRLVNLKKTTYFCEEETLPICKKCKNNKVQTCRSSGLRAGKKQQQQRNKCTVNNCININDKNYYDNSGAVNNAPPEISISGLGNLTRKIQTTIYRRLGNNILQIPEDCIEPLFNEMHLYPSKSKVGEMLQCARQCGDRTNDSTKYITFGEFCVFVGDMQTQRIKHHGNSASRTKFVHKYNVFLGGSCNPTTWRTDTAIPELEKYGISFYNPQVASWRPELVAEEHAAKMTATVLFFVIDNQTRSTSSMIEVSYLVAKSRCVVLVAHSYHQKQTIMGEPLSEKEFYDLSEAQECLIDIVKRNGMTVYNCVSLALQATRNLLKTTLLNEYHTEFTTNKLLLLKEIFNSYADQNGEISLVDLLAAMEKLMHRQFSFADFVSYLKATGVNLNTNVQRATFETFCILVTEFTSQDCDVSSTSSDSNRSNHQHHSCDHNQILRTNGVNNNNYNNNQSHTVFDLELMEDHSNHRQQITYDVFLGGSRSSRTNWRDEIVIPLLEKHCLSYSSRQMSPNGEHVNCCKDIVKMNSIVDQCRLLLFVITNDTRSLTTMLLAAYYIGLGSKRIVLCVQHLPDECRIHNETITSQATKDYNRARIYLMDIAKQSNVPVFENFEEAIQCVVYMRKLNG